MWAIAGYIAAAAVMTVALTMIYAAIEIALELRKDPW